MFLNTLSEASHIRHKKCYCETSAASQKAQQYEDEIILNRGYPTTAGCLEQHFQRSLRENTFNFSKTSYHL